jgi:flagellar hook assembly protein FlgD
MVLGANNNPRIHVYPNPGGANVTVYWEAPRLSGSVLQVFNVAGRLVRTLQANRDGLAASGSVFWDCRDEKGLPVASGIYMVRLSSASGQMAKHVVIMR